VTPDLCTAPAAWDIVRPEVSRSRPFWGVMTAFLVHGLVVSTWVSRIAGMKSALHLGDGLLGLCLLGAAIGSVTAIPVCGALVTRYGSRRIALWTGCGFALALVPLALTTKVAMLVPALVFYGVMAGANDVAMNALAVGTERLLGVPTMSRFHAMFSLGGIAGAGIGALVGARGVSLSGHLLAGSAICILLIWISGRMTIDTRTEESHAHAPSLHRIPLPLLALSTIGFCIFLSEGAIADWTAVYLKQVLRAGDGLAPIGYAAFSASMAAFRFAGDAITMRIGRSWTIRGGAAIAATGMALVAAAQSPALAIAGFALAGAGYSSIIPLVFAAGGRIPGVGEGVGVATVSGLGYLGFLAGPPAIGFLAEAFSLRAGIALLVALGLLSVVLVGVIQRKSQPSPLD